MGHRITGNWNFCALYFRMIGIFVMNVHHFCNRKQMVCSFFFFLEKISMCVKVGTWGDLRHHQRTVFGIFRNCFALPAVLP